MMEVKTAHQSVILILLKEMYDVSKFSHCSEKGAVCPNKICGFTGINDGRKL